jgi:hypothetical protein
LNNDSQAVVDEIAAEILAYLKTHPGAADTREGIVQWWLLRQRYLRGIEQVESALEVLMKRNLVVRKRTPDGTPVYAASDHLSSES